MRSRVRGWAVRFRARLLSPITVRFDAVDAQLATLARRVDDLEVLLQNVGGRLTTAGENSIALSEKQALIEHRVREIEQLLASPAADR